MVYQKILSCCYHHTIHNEVNKKYLGSKEQRLSALPKTKFSAKKKISVKRHVMLLQKRFQTERQQNIISVSFPLTPHPVLLAEIWR